MVLKGCTAAYDLAAEFPLPSVDGLQAIASHALRGLKDAVVPLVIAGIGYWLIGLGCGYVFGFRFGWGAPGLWGGVAIGLAFTGSLLAWRFEILAKRQLPE